MKDHRIAKTTFVRRTQRTRRVGKPRTSWLTSVLSITCIRLRMSSGMRREDVIAVVELSSWSVCQTSNAEYDKATMMMIMMILED